MLDATPQSTAQVPVAPPTQLRTLAPFVLGVVVSAVFTWLFIRKIDLAELLLVPARIKPSLIGVSLGIFLLEFVLRAIRWRILMAPVGDVSARPLVTATFIGFMANNLLPARAGELIRPLLAARKLDLPVAPVLVTTVMERVFDLVGLLSVFLLMTATLPFAGPTALEPAIVQRLQQLGATFGALGVLGIGGLFFLAANDARVRVLVERLFRPLPAPVARLLMRVYAGLASGLATFRTFRGPLEALLLSVVIWVNGALAIWIMTWAFGFELPFAGACFLSCTLALAVSVPQAPGFIGVWQVAVAETLMAWGVGKPDAQGFAMLFWLVSFTPVTTIGLAMLWREGLHLRQLMTARDLASSPRRVPV